MSQPSQVAAALSILRLPYALLFLFSVCLNLGPVNYLPVSPSRSPFHVVLPFIFSCNKKGTRRLVESHELLAHCFPTSCLCEVILTLNPSAPSILLGSQTRFQTFYLHLAVPTLESGSHLQCISHISFFFFFE
jgi:hypothetical protein